MGPLCAGHPLTAGPGPRQTDRSRVPSLSWWETHREACVSLGPREGGKIELGLQGEGNLISTQREAGEKHAESRDECAQKQSGQKWTHLRTGEDAAQAWPGLESVMARMWWPGISVGGPRQGMALGQL